MSLRFVSLRFVSLCFALLRGHIVVLVALLFRFASFGLLVAGCACLWLCRLLAGLFRIVRVIYV